MRTERISRHVVGLWTDEIYDHGVRIAPSTGLPVGASVASALSSIFERGQLVIEPWREDPLPDYDCRLKLLFPTAIERAAAILTNAI